MDERIESFLADVLALAWRVEPRRATRCQERKLQEWRLDCRGDQGTQMADPGDILTGGPNAILRSTP